MVARYWKMNKLFRTFRGKCFILMVFFFCTFVFMYGVIQIFYGIRFFGVFTAPTAFISMVKINEMWMNWRELEWWEK